MGVNRDDLQQTREGDADLALLAALLGASLTRPAQSLQTFSGKQAALSRLSIQRSSQLRQLAQRLLSGEITLAQFEALGAEIWIASNTQAAEIWVGGGRNLTAAQERALAGALQSEAEFWDNMVKDIRSGKVPMNGRISNRASMYGRRARATYYLLAEADATEADTIIGERNVLSPVDNCEGVGSCVGETARGIVPVGVLIPIGERICLSNCQCRVEYITVDGEAVEV